MAAGDSMRVFRFRRAAAALERPRRRLLRALAIFGPLFALLAAPARATVVFSAFGDVPYSTSEVTDLQQNVANFNLYSPSSFLVHLGDINSGSEQCQASRYQTVANILKTTAVPAFIVPGDNEWVNCSNPAQGWAWWQQYLLGLDQSFCGIWPVEEEVSRPENFSFMLDNVLFLGLNYVAGSPSTVTQASADWVNAQFAAHGASARAAVMMAQKEPGGVLFTAVKAKGHAFAKPVLYIHGNGHSWLVDSSFFGESNMLRVQVDRGTLAHPPVQVTVTSAGQFLFNRNPWPSGTPKIVRPPCSGTQPSLSIDDLFVNEGQSALFTVNLSGATGSAVSVNYSTQDQTARAGEDYTAKSGSLSFSGTTTQQQITVATTQDTAPEPAESFVVNLASASGAAIGKAQGAAVILDDDSAPPPSGGIPALRETVSGGSTSSSAVATSGPVGAGIGDLYLAAVSSKPNVGVASVSGLGLTWTPVRQQCAGRGQTGIALFRAQGSPSASGVVTANFSTAPTAAVISVARYSGASTGSALGNVASANTNGVSGACSGGADSAAYAFDLASGGADSLFFVAAGMRNATHQPGPGYTEIAETFAGSSGSMAGAAISDRSLGSPATVSVNGSFNAAVDWAVVAAEVRAAGVTLGVSSIGGGSVTLNPPGGVYASGTSVTLTAVPSAGYLFAGWTGDLTGTANPATLVMNANKTIIATFVTQYSVTTSTTGNGSVTLNPPGGSYAPGTLVTLTAVPGTAASFVGWSGDLTGTQNPTTLTVNANKSVGAQFTTAFTPAADARVSASSPTSNYGTDSALRIRAGSSASNSFLRFTVSGLAGQAVLSAKLRLFATAAADSGGTLYGVANTWTESGITWSTAPSIGGAPLASAGALLANQWVEYDVTSTVRTDGSYSFGLTSASSNSSYFSSREGANPPQLVLQTSAAVAPAASFSGNPLSGPAPLSVTFTDLSSGGPTGWLWSFGDTTTSTEQSPTHAYTSPGIYGVSLQVSNAKGTNSLARPAYVGVVQGVPTQSFAPAADAKVSEASPAVNYGTLPDLRLRTSAGGSWRSFLRFDVAGLVKPVVKATLRLHVDDGSSDGGALHVVPSTWTETGITWTTAPALDAPAIASLGSVATGAWVEVDVTATVVGNGSYAFGLANGGTDSAYYGSRESSNPPQLVIELAP